MIELTALSIPQPWAWAIIHGNRKAENRLQHLRYRGDLIIHSSKTVKREEFNAARDFLSSKGVVVPNRKYLSFGSIIGRVYVADFHHDSNYIQFIPQGRSLYSQLKNPVRFIPPIPFSGRQGLFKVSLPEEYGPDYTGFLEEIYPLVKTLIGRTNSSHRELMGKISEEIAEGKLSSYLAHKFHQLLTNNIKASQCPGIYVPKYWSALAPYYK
ncbi:hypothetical protein [Limnofasciculus baicalensis]|nr:hypothetical protein [Limnofasciculus baicalensis]